MKRLPTSGRSTLTVAAFAAAMLAVCPAFAEFVDASASMGSLRTELTWGATWADIDGDGWVDAFLNNHYRRAPYALRNVGGQLFSNVSQSSGLAFRIDYHSCKWSDFDRDGDLDVYCTTGADHGTAQIPARFMRNMGNGTFEDIAAATGTTLPPGRGRTVSWIDIDDDRDLDLFIGTMVEKTADPTARLYRNDGAAFTDITSSAGINLDGLVRNSLTFDHEGDGDNDLLVSFQARDGVNYPCTICFVVLRNDPGVAFNIIDARTLGISATWTRSFALGDYDNDGDLDLFQTSDTPGAKLFRNNGNQSFTSVSLASAGLSNVTAFRSVDAQWADFDNDGFLDLFVVRNDGNSSANAPDRLYINDGDGTFTDRTADYNAAGLTTGYGDAAAIADYDKNGFLDLLIANGYDNIEGSYQLLRNVGNDNHWLRIVVTDSVGIAEFGAKVWVHSGGRVQYREYGNSSSHATSHEPIAHFGLGLSTQADLVRVQWSDGSYSEIVNVAANQVVEIQRPTGGPVTVVVPNVVGLLQSVAQSALADAGLVSGATVVQPSSSVPAGNVLSQDPPGGVSVSAGTSVNLVVSSGPETVDVPLLEGLSQAAAESAITDAGLALGSSYFQSSDSIPSGIVIAQDPVAGIAVAPGSIVSIVISSGVPPQVVVPNVVGRSRSVAEAELVGAGLVPDASALQSSESVPAGEVISQVPAAGVSVVVGATVTLTVSSGPAPVMIAVPEVTGLDQATAESILLEAGLVPGVATTQSSPAVVAGLVISHAPAAGSVVTIGTNVDLVISSGPVPQIAVPDVVGLDQPSAVAMLEGIGLSVGEITPLSSQSVPAGRVMSQDPLAGATIEVGSSVALVVSSGPATVVVPNLVGLSQSAANSGLIDAGLEVGEISSEASSVIAAGHVISHNPAPGSNVSLGASVALVISTGPAVVSVPNLVGLTQVVAQSTLVDVGLALGSVSNEASSSVPAGHVVSQDPAANAAVSVGSSVALTVSSGPASVIVPDVIGMTETSAQSALTSIGLAASVVGTEASSTIPSGSVVSQNPTGGTALTLGATVALVLSSGPASAGAYLDFDGANDIVSIPSSASLRISNSITVEARIRAVTIASNQNQDRILRKGDDYDLMVSTSSSGCATGTAGTLQWSAVIGGQSRRICGGLLSIGNWHHVAGTYDGVTFALYLDGALVAAMPRTGKIKLSHVLMTIGNQKSLARAFDGDIEDIAIWSRALSPLEITGRASGALTGLEAGLVSYWPIDAGEGQAVRDVTLRANHGVLGASTAVENSDPIRR